MTWQGIPFLYDPNTISYGLSVSKIPEIAVHTSSGFAWETIIASVLGAIIASAIPATIAWWSINKNIKTLEEDRQKQQISFDADRNAQLDIASKNLNAQVLSNNRQQWINNLRDSISDYLGSVSALRRSRVIARWCWDSAQKDNRDFHIDHRDAVLAMTDDNETMDRLAYKIKLLVNPVEPVAIEIINVLNEMPQYTGDFQNKPDKLKIKELSDKLILHSQIYLKAEWERVKLMQ